MKTTKPKLDPMKTRATRFFLSLTLAASSSPMLTAQAVSTGAAAKEEEEEFIELSPFEVESGEDTGYAATSSLAGSRLNTKLQDVASAISVVTAEFMADTGSKKLEDVLVYTTNTEVAGIGGNFYGGASGDRNTEYRDRLLAEPHRATRVRGLNEADLAREYFASDLPMDWYNTTRIDIQRGPNSILFGLGSPAGIINNTLKTPNLREQANWAEVVVSSYGSHREVLDVDVPLVKDKLGIRVVALNDERKYRREPTYNDDRRLYAAVRWEPKLAEGIFTQVDARFEAGKIKANRPDFAPPIDMLSVFFDPDRANKNTLDFRGIYDPDFNNYYTQSPANAWWNEAAGTLFSDPKGTESGAGGYDAVRQRGGEATWWNAWAGIANPTATWGDNHPLNQKSYFADNPIVMAIINDYEATTGNAFNGFGETNWIWSTFNEGPFTLLNDSLAGPNKFEFNNFEATNAQITQTYFHGKLGWDLALDRQKYRYGGESLFTGNTIGIDVNETFRDGTPNPNVGRAVVFSGAGGNRQEIEREAYRFTAFYKLDTQDFLGNNTLGMILGDHTFTGVLSEQRRENFGYNYSLYKWPLDYALDAFAGGWMGLDGWQALHYVSDDLRGYASFEDIPTSAVTPLQARHDADSTQTTRAFVNGGEYYTKDYTLLNYRDDFNTMLNGASAGYNRTKSKSFVWQSRLLNDAIIPLFGWREDDYLREDKGNVPRDPDNFDVALPWSPDWGYEAGSIVTANEQRRSYGIVLHTDQLLDLFDTHLPYGFKVSFFYNESTTFRPSELGVDIYGHEIPTPSGETKDYGVLISAFDDKLTLRITDYETVQKNTPIIGTQPDFGWNIGSLQRAMNSIRSDGVTGSSGRQPVPEWLINNWMFGESGYDTTIANTPLPSDWRGNPDILDQPLRLRRSQDPSSATYVAEGDIDPVTERPYQAPPVDADEREYREAWFNARTEAEWSRPVDQEWWDITNWQQDSNGFWIWGGAPNRRSVNNLTSTGIEVELTAQPLPNWRVAFNISETKAVRNNILLNWDDFIANEKDFRLDGIETVAFTYWDVDGYADIPEFSDLNSQGEKLGNRWNASVFSPYTIAQATEGRTVDELRRWHWNLVNNYDFKEGALKGVGIGAAVRWQDEGIIGHYPHYDTEAGSWVPDLEKPIKVDAETHFDFWVSYRRKLMKDKVDWVIQLNVRDVFADGDFIPTRANPDGSVAQSVLPSETTWSLSSSFSF